MAANLIDPVVVASDLGAMIAARPWRSVAIAFALGAGLGLAHRSRSPIGRAIAAAVGGATLATMRGIAAARVASYAKSWLDQQLRPHARPGSDAVTPPS